jgi:hypothetical protein
METVIKRIKQDDRGKREMIGKARNLRTGATSVSLPSLIISNKKKGTVLDFPISTNAFKQLCTLLGIPADYIKQCPPKLRVENINHWLSNFKEGEKWAIRMKEDVVRGFMNSARIPFMNIKVMEMVQSLEFMKGKKIIRDWFFLDDTTMHARILFPETSIFLDDKKKADGIIPGIHVSNSEIGMHGFRLDFVAVQESSDSAIVGMFNGKRYIRPNGVVTDIEKLKTLVETGLTTFETVTKDFADRIKKAKGKNIKDFGKWMDHIKKKYRFAGNLAERAAEIFNAGEEKNGWAAFNSLGRTAREKLTGEKRYQMEALVGNIADSK